MTPAPPPAWGVSALYVHIPFCERRCEYCDFASVGGLRGHVEYVEALRAELRALAAALPGVVLDTVFVGGGTPGLLPPPLLAAVLDEVRAGFGIAPGCELTMEANPSSTTAERAEAWLAAGVNRVSLGVQSLDPATLRFLGRVHDADRALGALADLRAAGVPRISADLIYAVPTLSDAAWERSVEGLLGTGLRHLSAYELTVEPGTPLHRSVAAGRVRIGDADTALRQHWRCVELGEAAGLLQYEVSNLAVPGEECRHNLVYWANGHYLAAGVGAHGHLPVGAARALGVEPPAGAVAVRLWHHREPLAYRTAVAAAPRLAVEGWEPVTAGEAEAERILVGLRRSAGVRLEAAAVAEARALADAGLIALEGGVARTTRRGQELLDGIALRLVHSA